jgi:putative hydrolase of the HAD superfamily
LAPCFLWADGFERERMSIQAVILDADGVVIHPWRFARYLEREHAITPEMTRSFFRTSFEDCLVGRADIEDVLPPFLHEWGWRGSLDEFLKTWFEVDDAVDTQVIDVIRPLRRSGVLCCLATNQERRRTAYMRTEMGFSEVFDRLYFSCELGCQKPDSAYYGAIERDLGLAGDGILFWDDAAVNVESARDTGWNAEVYTGYEPFARALAEALGGGAP